MFFPPAMFARSFHTPQNYSTLPNILSLNRRTVDWFIPVYWTTPPPRQIKPQQIITHIKSNNRHDIVQMAPIWNCFLQECAGMRIVSVIKTYHGNEPVVQRARCGCQAFLKNTYHWKNENVNGFTARDCA